MTHITASRVYDVPTVWRIKYL